MNSIGILYTLRNSSEPSKNNVSAELHVNYWKVPIRNGAYKRWGCNLNCVKACS